MLTYLIAMAITTQNLLFAPKTYSLPDPYYFNDQYSYDIAQARFIHHGNWNLPIEEGNEGFPVITWEEAALEAGKLANTFNPEVDDVEFDHWAE
jgi:hypothetical protein